MGSRLVPLDDDGLRAKFIGLVEPVHGGAKAQELAQRLWDRSTRCRTSRRWSTLWRSRRAETMAKRIFLVHPTPLAVPPVDEAFKTLWPQAQVLNLLDESLYADVGANGELTPALYARVGNLFRHCEASGADGIVFSGSTFGPAVEEGRKGIKVPVLRIEEGMMDEAVARGGSILVVSTQKRAMPVVRGDARRVGQTRRQDADDQGHLGRRRA